MANLGMSELLLIFVVVLLLFGAKRIPEIARGLGKGIREFKDATNDIKKEITVDDTQARLQQPQYPNYPRQDAYPNYQQQQQSMQSPYSTPQPMAPFATPENPVPGQEDTAKNSGTTPA